MSRLLNLIEAHYLIAAFLTWTIIYEGFKTIRQFLRAIQLHPDYHTHNHITQQVEEEEDEEEEDGTDTELTSSENHMLTSPRPQPIPRPGTTLTHQVKAVGPDSSPKLLTRVERVLRNVRGGNS